MMSTQGLTASDANSKPTAKTTADSNAKNTNAKNTNAKDDEPIHIEVYGEYAGFVTRLVAFVTDILIVIAIISIMGAVASLLEDFLNFNATTSTLLNGIIVIVSLVLMQTYSLFFWMLIGQTPGKYLMGLRIIKTDGTRVTIGVCIRRLIGYYISALLLLGYILVLFDNRRQGFHDKFAGTFVIYAWSFDKNLERGQTVQSRSQLRRSKMASKKASAA